MSFCRKMCLKMFSGCFKNKSIKKDNDKISNKICNKRPNINLINSRDKILINLDNSNSNIIKNDDSNNKYNFKIINDKINPTNPIIVNNNYIYNNNENIEIIN